MLKNKLCELDESCYYNFDTDVCGTCKLGKSHRFLFYLIHEKSKEAFEIVHVDV